MTQVGLWELGLPQTFSTEHGLLVIGTLFGIVVLCLHLFQAIQNAGLKKSFSLPYLKFAYVSFLKPHTGKIGEGQQSALESFYSAQASVYDATRKHLLRGREDMLGMIVAQLQARDKGFSTRKPVWYDIGGGTGYNIEVMDKLVGINMFFEHIFLVDLSPSLCEIAQQRIKQSGWNNVTVLCQDAKSDQYNEAQADLVTMSYSLSMIPDFYSVVDLLTGLLTPDGFIGVCDFYVQSVVDVSSRNYTGGMLNRHVNWFGRIFWRAWFDADRVNLDAGRRDYVEYRFGTILSASERNYLLGGIPYYIFIGCHREAGWVQQGSRSRLTTEQLEVALAESPCKNPEEYQTEPYRGVHNEIRRPESYRPAIVNLTANLPLPASFYQQHRWRTHYNDLLPKHQQFKNEYIYAFNWEDPKVDQQVLDITKDDVILAIASAGDNVLDYLLESPAQVHAVDLNPNQNHLLELKCAAFTALSYSECWSLFGEGNHPDFRGLLINKLSPHLSSHAFQYWLNHTSAFCASTRGLYNTGGSRHAINLIRLLFKIFNLTSRVRTFCNVDTLNEQRELWPGIRDVLLSWPLHWLVVSTCWWSWKAAGVPREQRALIIEDFKTQQNTDEKKRKSTREVSGEAIWKYVADTLDPVVQHTQISRENYFYYVCLQGKYSKKCHPRYLSPKSYVKLNNPSTLANLRIHTDSLMGVITAHLAPSSITVAVLMDSMDWFTPPRPSSSTPSTPEILAKFHLSVTSSIAGAQAANTNTTTTSSRGTKESSSGSDAATEQIAALYRVLKPGGRVLFRSAALRPWYVDLFEARGFKVECVGKRVGGACIDRVNMYASAWLCTKVERDVDGAVIADGRDRGRGLTRRDDGGGGGGDVTTTAKSKDVVELEELEI